MLIRASGRDRREPERLVSRSQYHVTCYLRWRCDSYLGPKMWRTRFGAPAALGIPLHFFPPQSFLRSLFFRTLFSALVSPHPMRWANLAMRLPANKGHLAI